MNWYRYICEDLEKKKKKRPKKVLYCDMENLQDIQLIKKKYIQGT